MKYDERKAANVAAFFIKKEGIQIDKLKLMKLMYLSERKSLKEYGELITGDELYSLPKGPVLSKTLDCINYGGKPESDRDNWEKLINDSGNHKIGLKADCDFRYLSEADVDVLESVWNEFGKNTGGQLVEITHRVCAEWEDPGRSSSHIPYSRVLKAVGFDNETAEDIEQTIMQRTYIDEMFDSLSR